MGICQSAEDRACSRKAGVGHVLLALVIIGTWGDISWQRGCLGKAKGLG